MDHELAFGLMARESNRQLDPLAEFDWPSLKHQRIAGHFANGIEVHHRAGNMAAKTRTMAAAFVACCQQRRGLAGVRLPVFLEPPRAAILVPSYKQAIDSSNKAIRHWLGDWPHEIGWVSKALGYIGLIRIRPIDCPYDDPAVWSSILFVSQEDNNPRSVLGQRWDIAGSDEPYRADYWREVRKNAKLRWIAETPLKKSEWEHIQADFAGCIETVKGGRIECVTSLYDNKFLSDEERAALVESYRGDPYAEARIWGHYLDLEGDSPWGGESYTALQRRRGLCLPGRKLEITLPGDHVAHLCRQWFAPKDVGQSILVADLCEGIDDGKHDPARFDVMGRKSGLHACSWRGFSDPYHEALLAASIAEAYEDAWIDFDATGGYGQAFMRGLVDYRSLNHPSGYRRIVRTDHADKPGQIDSRFGCKITDGVRAENISAIREWLLMPDEKAEGAFHSWDSGVFDDLLAVRMVRMPSGAMKVMSTGKDHDEALFTLGRLLVLNKVLPWLPEENQRERTIHERLREEFGRDVLPPRVKPNGRVKHNLGIRP